jgi:hypothetical protein
MPTSKRPNTQILFSVHGINASDWQEEVRDVFTPFFDYRPLRYPQFQGRFGAFRLAFGIWSPLVAAVATFGVAFYTRSYYWTVLVALVGCLCSREEAKATRRSALGHLREEHEDSGSFETAHIIAHSFGTLLVSQLLERYEYCRFGNVIFVGSVLPSRYDWTKRDRVGALRNETGSEDFVVDLAGWARKLVPGLGASGKSGFVGPKEVIHTTSCMGPCLECSESGRAKIHNVGLSYKHSEFLACGHALQLWLPILWGYIPEEYARFVRLCVEAASNERACAWGSLVDVERRILLSKWSWTHGRTLSSHVRREVIAYNAVKRGTDLGRVRPKQLACRAIRVCWIAIAEADEELRKPRGNRSQRRLTYLFPTFAIGSAVEAVFSTQFQSVRPHV